MWYFLVLSLFEDAEPKDPNIYEDRFVSDHIYQMRFLEQRLYCKNLPHLTHELGLTHVALGFVDVETSDEMVLEYTNVPDNGTENSSMPNPEISVDEKGNATFIWHRTHQVFIRPLINVSICRWETQTVAHNGIQGKILNQLLKDYAVPFSDGNGTIYKLFGVRTHENMQQYEQFYSVNCHDFAWGAMQYLRDKLNVSFNDIKFGTRNYAFYLINGSKKDWLPRKLDLKNTTDNQIALNYFQSKAKFSSYHDLQHQVFEATYKQLRKSYQIVFFSPDNDYYVLTTKEIPVVWYKVEQQEFPGAINDFYN